MLLGPRMSRMSSSAAAPTAPDVGAVLADIGSAMAGACAAIAAFDGAMVGVGTAIAEFDGATVGAGTPIASIGTAIVDIGTAIEAVVKNPIATAPQARGARLLPHRLMRAGARGS